MSVKLTRAEKTSDRFQEVLNKFIESGYSFRNSLRRARKKLASEEGYPSRR